MGSDHSEQIKSLPDKSEPLKGNDEHYSTSQFDKKDENIKKVKVDQTEDPISTADEQIKESMQDNQDSKDGSKDLSSTPEDSGVSLGQGMDDSLQPVSLVCHCQESEPICNEFDISMLSQLSSRFNFCTWLCMEVRFPTDSTRGDSLGSSLGSSLCSSLRSLLPL